VIVVIGEVLVDLVAEGGGTFSARPGGGPYNTARTVARLGAPVVFAGRLSHDGFGRMLRARLEADGVRLGIPEPSELPTTLAVADIDDGGSAQYSFYLEKTAAADVSYDHLTATVTGATVTGTTAVAVNGGALGFVMDPLASSIERVVAEALPAEALLMVDPNCRPGTISDREGYLRRLNRIFARADVVKASVEDLAYLFPGLPPEEAAAALLRQGAALVLVTDGPRPARAFLPTFSPTFSPKGQEISVAVPEVDVVDTIGAGDAFGGAFLVAWTEAGLGNAELREAAPETADAIRDALAFAAEAAARTCARPGADPPSRAEMTWKPGGQTIRLR
jgi:fructokinase